MMSVILGIILYGLVTSYLFFMKPEAKSITIIEHMLALVPIMNSKGSKEVKRYLKKRMNKMIEADVKNN